MRLLKNKQRHIFIKIVTKNVIIHWHLYDPSNQCHPNKLNIKEKLQLYNVYFWQCNFRNDKYVNRLVYYYQNSIRSVLGKFTQIFK